MIVYHIGHLGIFPLCITHKLFFYREEEAVFIIDKFFLNKNTVDYFEKNIEKFSWLGKIITYNERVFLDVADEKQLENKTVSFFDELLYNNNLDSNKVSMFYNTFDTINLFGVYLRLKELPFSIIEGFPGQLGMNRYDLNNRPVYDGVLKKHQALSAVGKTLVKTIQRNYEETIIRPKDNFIRLNYEDLISYLPTSDGINILHAYSLDELFLDVDRAVLMVMSSGWIIHKLNPPTRNSFFLLYQLYADYFMLNSSAKLIIKPHPNTDFPLDFWKNQFPEAMTIPGYFPSNFIRFIPNLKIDKIIGTGSSSTNISLNNSPEILSSTNYYTFYYILHRFYITAELIKALSLQNAKLFHIGMHNNFTWAFEGAWGIGKSEWANFKIITNNSVFIIDNIFWNGPKDKEFLDEAIKNSDDSNLFIFLNSKNDYCFYNPNNLEIMDYIIPITIEKTATREDINSDLDSETIYVFCKNQDIRKKILNFSLRQNLANTGIEISVKPISQEVIDKNNKDLSLKMSESLKSERDE